MSRLRKSTNGIDFVDKLNRRAEFIKETTSPTSPLSKSQKAIQIPNGPQSIPKERFFTFLTDLREVKKRVNEDLKAFMQKLPKDDITEPVQQMLQSAEAFIQVTESDVWLIFDSIL